MNNSRVPQLRTILDIWPSQSGHQTQVEGTAPTRGVLSCNRFAFLASEAEPEQESGGAVAAQVRVPSRRVALVPQSAQGTPRSIQDVAASHFDLTRGASGRGNRGSRLDLHSSRPSSSGAPCQEAPQPRVAALQWREPGEVVPSSSNARFVRVRRTMQQERCVERHHTVHVAAESDSWH